MLRRLNFQSHSDLCEDFQLGSRLGTLAETIESDPLCITDLF